MTTDTVLCPVCGSDRVEVERREKVARSSRGTSAPYKQEISRCRECGEGFLTQDQSEDSSRAHAAALRKAEGLMSREAIREARIRLEMTQDQFEAALGVGKKTVVRWERGTVPPSSAANGLLWLAARYPGIFLEYARERSPDTAPAPSGGRIVGTISVAANEDSKPTGVHFGSAKGDKTIVVPISTGGADPESAVPPIRGAIS